MSITVSPGRLGRLLLGVVVGLSLVSLSVGVLGRLTGHERLMGFGRIFSVAAESNIPTWYSSSTLLVCAGLLWLIAVGRRSQGDPFARHWRILAIGVLLLSVDEASSIHETVGAVMERVSGSSGLMQLSWVLPAAVCVIILGLMYIPFTVHLPSATRKRLLLAAVVFGSGALGLEALGGEWRTLHGATGFAFTVMEAVEEFLEMAGVVMLVHALTQYISVAMGGVDIRIAEEIETVRKASITVTAETSKAA